MTATILDFDIPISPINLATMSDSNSISTMQTPDELLKTVAELRDYYQRAIQANSDAIAKLEAENNFFQTQIHHANALIDGYQGLHPSQPQVESKKIPEASTRTYRTNFRLSPLYAGMTVMAAITKVLAEQRGKPLNAADIAERIFLPHYSTEMRAYLHGLVTKELSRGAKEKRFDRAYQKGYYTWDISELPGSAAS